ncbi:MAG: hypothetical protein P8Y16_06190 [Sulfurimonas sp.]
MKHLVLLIVTTLTLQAQIYDTDQDSILKTGQATKNQFFYNDFKEIIRFEPLVFSDNGVLTEKSQNYFNNKIVKKIKETKNKNFQNQMLTEEIFIACLKITPLLKLVSKKAKNLHLL